jgi:phenylpropionate dioxygenase-like ring-hydroxylating dioxygenase large terminal subunit
VSIILVRATNGAVRGYLNMCMHRGARLVNTCGRSQFLTCPFHAWSYDLDGELVNLPQAQAFAGVDLNARRLIEVPVAEWHGMIFVRLQPGGEEIDVALHLGPIAPLFRALDLSAVQVVKAEQFAVNCNWKLALGTFCEAYHIPVVHAKTLAPQLISYVTVQDEFDCHARYANPPIKLADYVGKPEAEWPRSNYNAVHYLYPNTIVVYSDALDGSTPLYALFSMFPGASVGEATVLASTYRPASAKGAEQLFADTHDFSINLIKNEDLHLVAELWRNLQCAPPGHKLVFGRSEWLLQRYHRRIAADIGMPLP